MIKGICLLILALAGVVSFIILCVNAIKGTVCYIKHRDSFNKAPILKRGIIFVVIVLVLTIFIVITQLTAFTPAIKDSNGKKVEGSISELTHITLNGHKEWISIRGEKKDAPVLLFLAGGPGGTQMAAVRYELAELEKNFVVVNWDQPGSGKSYNCMKRKDISKQRELIIRKQWILQKRTMMTNLLRNLRNRVKHHIMKAMLQCCLRLI